MTVYLSIGVSNPEPDPGPGGDDLVGDIAVGTNAVANHSHGANNL